MLRTMDAKIFGLPPTVFWPIIAVAVVLVLVLTVLLVCCCYCCYCKNTRKYKYYHQHRYYPVNHGSLETYDDFESTTQPTSHRSDSDIASDVVEEEEGALWPGYEANADSTRYDHPVFKTNHKRAILPLPKNFQDFIIDIIIPSFKEQRSTGNQFAVVVLLSEKDFNNIFSATFVPSNDGRPLVDNYFVSMPHNAIDYGNYIAARPISNSWHSEEEIFGKYSSINSPFSQLWTAYMRHNGSPPKCILLYSWNLPCSRCTDVIIRSLNNDTYSCTSVIVAHTMCWQRESEDGHRRNKENFVKENITVVQV